MQPILQNNIETIRELCRRYHVKELYAFGSVVRDDFKEDSDVDFLVKYNLPPSDPFVKLEIMDALKKKLEDLLHREVDLIQYDLLTNKYLKYFINQEKKMIYGEA